VQARAELRTDLLPPLHCFTHPQLATNDSYSVLHPHRSASIAYRIPAFPISDFRACTAEKEQSSVVLEHEVRCEAVGF
jgi:hypothetical protein